MPTAQRLPKASRPLAREERPSAARGPLRVCYVIDRLSKAGTEMQLLSLLNHLDRRRAQPYLCLLKSDDAESRALEPADCPVQRLGVRSLHHLATAAKAARFARFLRRERIDVVQVYFRDSTNFGVTAAQLANVPAVVRTRFNLGYWMTPVDRWLGRAHSLLVDATVANCEACRQAVIADEWADPESVQVIENGVELEPYAQVPPPVFAPGGPRPRRVGLVANLRPVKDPQLLVQAAGMLAAKHPGVEFHLGGEGELRGALERQIADLGLQHRVKLHGQVTDVPKFLAAVDLAVLCSRSEGLSNAVLEYMAAGRAVVATAVGGTPQLIEDGVHGLLVPPGDGTQLAAALDRLLAAPELAARLAAAAQRRVRERFDTGGRARRYEDLYERLLAVRR